MAAPKVHSIQHSEQGTLVTFDLGAKLSPSDALMEINSALSRMGIIALALPSTGTGTAPANDNAKAKTEAKPATAATPKAEAKAPPPPPPAAASKPKAKAPPPPPPAADEDEDEAGAVEGEEDLSGLEDEEGGGESIDPAILACTKLSEIIVHLRKVVKLDRAGITKWCADHQAAVPVLAAIPNLSERVGRQLDLAKIT